MSLNPFRGHPPGLVICFTTELWERFSYYGMRALLVFYLTQHFLYSDDESFLIYGAYTALVYLMPVFGGIFADQFLGSRKAVTWGAILLVCGHLGLAFEGPQAMEAVVDGASVVHRDSAYLNGFFLSLALIVTGVGFLKTNVSTVVGLLYDKSDPRRDAGFTIFYMGINIGAAVAPLLTGWLAYEYGWSWGFGVAGVGMLAGLLGFLKGQKHLHGHAEPPDPELLKRPIFAGINVEWLIYSSSFLLVLAAWFLLQNQAMVGQLLALMGMAVSATIIWYAFFKCAAVDRDRMIVISVLILFTVGFWAFYEQMGSSLALFADRMVDRVVFGYEIPAASLLSLPAIFVILLAPLYSMMWYALGRRGIEPQAPMKFVIAISLLALGFLTLAFGIGMTAAGEQVALIWFVLNFLLLVMGELCLSPVSMAMVTRLSPPRIVAMMMGVLFLAISASNFISGLIAQLTSVDRVAGEMADPQIAMANYREIYQLLGFYALAVGAVLLLLAPILKKLMHLDKIIDSGSYSHVAVELEQDLEVR
jgi:POT family proton-dependent oligopeptide transporter